MPTSRRCRITATSPMRHSTASSRTAPPAHLLWPTGFLCGWSVGLEFPAGQLAESDYWREQFQTISEDVFVRNLLMHSAHWRFHDDALYKSTFFNLMSELLVTPDRILISKPHTGTTNGLRHGTQFGPLLIRLFHFSEINSTAVV